MSLHDGLAVERIMQPDLLAWRQPELVPYSYDVLLSMLSLDVSRMALFASFGTVEVLESSTASSGGFCIAQQTCVATVP